MPMTRKRKYAIRLLPVFSGLVLVALSAMAYDQHDQSRHVLAALPVTMMADSATGTASSATTKTPATLVADQGSGVLRVGDQLDSKRVHLVTRPGLYGIGHVPEGCAYGVIDGYLVRYDTQTTRILSIVRSVDTLLD